MPNISTLDPAERAAAEAAAREMLRDLVGPDYSDTTLRVATDHLLSFRRQPRTLAPAPPTAALDRLFEIAKSDTGQAARVANFLLAWWNGNDLGHFQIADLFCLDLDIASDIVAVLGFLAQHPGAIYADTLGYRGDVMALLAHWRGITEAA
ncbi:hypothetical protein [Sphingobium yanoikuyae]|uniref:DUF7673 family protein n=1 Tax=Sphingobium yanoikuyae TaxID=13690 RepID=UPI000AE3FC07